MEPEIATPYKLACKHGKLDRGLQVRVRCGVNYLNQIEFESITRGKILRMVKWKCPGCLGKAKFDFGHYERFLHTLDGGE